MTGLVELDEILRKLRMTGGQTAKTAFSPSVSRDLDRGQNIFSISRRGLVSHDGVAIYLSRGVVIRKNDMDGQRFEHVAKALANGVSRRGVLRGAAAGLVAAAGMRVGLASAGQTTHGRSRLMPPAAGSGCAHASPGRLPFRESGRRCGRSRCRGWRRRPCGPPGRDRGGGRR
jgi:hypothetical protein